MEAAKRDSHESGARRSRVYEVDLPQGSIKARGASRAGDSALHCTRTHLLVTCMLHLRNKQGRVHLFPESSRVDFYFDAAITGEADSLSGRQLFDIDFERVPAQTGATPVWGSL